MMILDPNSTAKLLSLDAGIQPSQIMLNEPAYTLGRSDSCDIVIDDANYRLISRLHARIEARGPRYWLYDEQSANGTFINGQRVVEPHLLTDQDAIGLGSPPPLFVYEDTDRTRVNESRLNYDDRLARFTLDATPIELTPGQFRLLQLLFLNLNAVCSRAECYEAMRGIPYDHDRDTNALDRAISKLRSRLQTVAEDGNLLIVLERGHGYRLNL